MSKGSARRPTDEAAFQANYDAIFGQQVQNSYDEKLSIATLNHQKAKLEALCRHPDACANPFCNCEVKHEAK